LKAILLDHGRTSPPHISAEPGISAAVLFGLAAQQGQGNERKIPETVLEFEIVFSAYETQDDL
jgi:hypothetical protein